MKISQYLLKNFIQYFCVVWFILIIFLVGINLLSTFTTYYVNYGLNLKDIFRSSLYYIPTTMVLTMPFAVLFASSYIFGKMAMEGEIIGLISLGYSPFQLVKPQILVSCLLCILSFYIAEFIAIDSINKHQVLLKRVTQQEIPFTILREPGKHLFYSQNYSESEDKFYEIIILIFDDQQQLAQRIDAKSALKNNDGWLLEKVRILNTNHQQEILSIDQMLWKENPTLGRINTGIGIKKQLSIKETQEKIKTLKSQNVSYQNQYVDLMQRYTNPFELIIYAIPPLILITGRCIGITRFALEYLLIVGFIKIMRMSLITFAIKTGINAMIATSLPIILGISLIFYIYIWKNNMVVKK